MPVIYLELPAGIEEIYSGSLTLKNRIHYRPEEIKENKEGKESGKAQG